MQGAKRGGALRRAIIASVLALAATAAAADSTHLADPVSVTFRLSDGRDIHGEVQSWDLAAVYGTFGRIEWRQLEAAEAWHVHAAIIDPDIGEHWLSVGRVLSQLEGGQVHAQRALRWAAWSGRRTADAAEQLLAELPLTPKGFVPPRPYVHRADDGPFESWPAMTGQEQAEATAQLSNEMEAMLEALGLTMLLYEQPQMLVYSDMPVEEARSLLIGLQATYLTLLRSSSRPSSWRTRRWTSRAVHGANGSFATTGPLRTSSTCSACTTVGRGRTRPHTASATCWSARCSTRIPPGRWRASRRSWTASRGRRPWTRTLV